MFMHAMALLLTHLDLLCPMILTSKYLHEKMFFYIKGLCPVGSSRVALQWGWPVQTNIYNGAGIYEVTWTKSWTRLIYMHGMCASVTVRPRAALQWCWPAQTNIYNGADIYEITWTKSWTRLIYMHGMCASVTVRPRVALQWCWPVQTNIYNGGDIYELTQIVLDMADLHA